MPKMWGKKTNKNQNDFASEMFFLQQHCILFQCQSSLKKLFDSYSSLSRFLELPGQTRRGRQQLCSLWDMCGQTLWWHRFTCFVAENCSIEHPKDLFLCKFTDFKFSNIGTFCNYSVWKYTTKSKFHGYLKCNVFIVYYAYILC